MIGFGIFEGVDKEEALRFEELEEFFGGLGFVEDVGSVLKVFKFDAVDVFGEAVENGF
jgi:hypothetical protein